jgi:VWFA-related protein
MTGVKHLNSTMGSNPMKLFAAALALLSSIGVAHATAVAQVQSASEPTLRTQSNVVLVPALVRNAKGEVVFSLNASDFRVTDDGVEQPLKLDEDTGNEPLALVIAVECGGVGRQHLDNYQHLGAVIDALVGAVPHRIAVVEFDSTPSLLQVFTRDADVAADALDHLDSGDRGAAILDGLKFSLDLLRNQPPNYRRAILLLSETIDHGSQTKLDDALRAISDTNTAIYSVAFSSGKAGSSLEAGHILNDTTPGPEHGCMARDATNQDENRAVQTFDCLGLLLPPLRLAKIAAIAASAALEKNVPETVARLTGGEYFPFNNSRSLQRDLITISNHVPNRYVLSFQPPSPHPGFHAVALKLKDHPGLHLEARSGYWVDSAGEPGTQP